MNRESPLRPNRTWLIVLAAWTVPGLIATVVYYVGRMEQEQAVSWVNAALYMLPFWYLWALLTPLAIWAARRLPIDGPRRWRNVGSHLVLATLFGLTHLAVGLVIIRAVIPGPPERPYPEALQYFFRSYYEFEILIYGAVVGATYAVDYYRRSRRDALRAAELEVRLAHAHLQALKMQLQPHFLFNTLHAASSLMDDDVKAARRMLSRLSDLLRVTLETQGIHEITLEQELEYLDLYLDIERERFPDRLEVEFEVEPGAMRAMVPNLVLQPLVENAVRYGIAPRPEGGIVEVAAWREGDDLQLRVRDDGQGPSRVEGGNVRVGVGLGNTRARLEELYGPDHEFRAYSPKGTGFTVEITIPYREAAKTSRKETRSA